MVLLDQTQIRLFWSQSFSFIFMRILEKFWMLPEYRWHEDEDHREPRESCSWRTEISLFQMLCWIKEFWSNLNRFLNPSVPSSTKDVTDPAWMLLIGFECRYGSEGFLFWLMDSVFKRFEHDFICSQTSIGIRIHCRSSVIQNRRIFLDRLHWLVFL